MIINWVADYPRGNLSAPTQEVQLRAQARGKSLPARTG
jgi:hypothetical protein